MLFEESKSLSTVYKDGEKLEFPQWNTATMLQREAFMNACYAC